MKLLRELLMLESKVTLDTVDNSAVDMRDLKAYCSKNHITITGVT